MAFGIASLDPTVPEISGRTQGFSSSTAAELMGLFGAIMAANPSQDIIISLDNLSVVNNFTKLVMNRALLSPREKSRCNHALQWASIARACQDRTGYTQVKWIKGHNMSRDVHL
jgi:ribonuclease HI